MYVYRSVARVSLLKTSSVECQAPGMAWLLNEVGPEC